MVWWIFFIRITDFLFSWKGVSEYLFDLFDANCMDEYKRFEALDERAIEAFEPSSSEKLSYEWHDIYIYDAPVDSEDDEYTLEQSQLHREFCTLFESFCEAFINEKGLTIEEFYEIAREHISPDAKSESKEHANEVVDTIKEVADFRAWAARVRGEARRRKDFILHSKQGYAGSLWISTFE